MSGQGGNWAVILGCSGGTGGATACELARAGYDIFGVHRGRRAEEARLVEETVRSLGRRMHVRIGPAGRAEEVVETAAEVERVCGPGGVRVFVHSLADASYGTFSGFTRGRLKPHQFQKTFDVMAHSFAWWVQELLDRKLLDRATLIALSNSTVDSVVHGWGMVAAAKAALDIYVRYIAHEVGPLGHRAVLLKFGVVETRAIQMAFSPREWDHVKSGLENATPSRRMIRVEDVASVIRVLAGPEGAWFNAGHIDLTGGQTSALLDPIFNFTLEEP